MADRQSTDTARRARPVPAVVTPLTKVNLALPFSKITVEEPDGATAELASIVAALSRRHGADLGRPVPARAVQARPGPRVPAALRLH